MGAISQYFVVLVYAIVTSAGLASSPCEFVQVFPLHHIGLGATDDVMLALPGLSTEVAYALDNVACTHEAGRLRCPIETYSFDDDDVVLYSLLEANGTAAARLTMTTASSSSQCFLNETAGGTLLRHAYLTAVVTLATITSPLLPQPRILLRWRAPSTLSAAATIVVGSDGAVVQLAPTIISVDARMASTTLSATATFPIYSSRRGSDDWSVTLKVQGEQQRWLSAVIPAAARYRYGAPLLSSSRHNWTAGATRAGFAAVVPVIYNLSAVAVTQFGASSNIASTVLASGAASSFLPMVDVVVNGAFPICAVEGCRRPTVTLVRLHEGAEVLCNTISLDTATLRCFANLSSSAYNSSMSRVPLPVGLGFVATNATTGIDTPLPVPLASVARGWATLGVRTRTVVRVPTNIVTASMVRLHCTSSNTIYVWDHAGDLLCSNSNSSGVAMSTWVVLSNRTASNSIADVTSSYMPLMMECCAGNQSNGACRAGSLADICAVSMELVAEHTAEANESTATASTTEGLIAAFHVETHGGATGLHNTTALFHDTAIRSMASLSVESDALFLTIANSTIVLSVPSLVANASQCRSSVITTTQLDQLPLLQGRFAPNVNGTWRSAVGRCSWDVVVPVHSCDMPMVEPMPTGGSLVDATTVFCGPRAQFLDPIPYANLELPSDMQLQSNLGNTTTTQTWVPRVVFPHFPAATPVVIVSPTNITIAALTFAAPPPNSSSGGVWGALLTANAPGGALVTLLVASNLSTQTFNVTSVGLTTSIVSPSVALLDNIVWLEIRSAARCTPGPDTASLGSFNQCLNVTVVAPTTGAACGYYRVVATFDSIGGVLTIPSDEVFLTMSTMQQFFFLRATITTVSLDTVGALGGGLLTMLGRNFPVVASSMIGMTTLRMSVFGDTADHSVACVQLLGSDTFLSWTMGNLVNITGPRVINTIQANWTICIAAIVGVVSGSDTTTTCAQVINGSVGILQPTALPRITEVSPMLLSSAADASFIIQGTSLSLREISVCAERAVSSTTVTPFYRRDVASCHWCTPSVSNATHVECSIPLAVRLGSFSVYVSSPALGGGVTIAAPVQFVFAITSITPTGVSAFGSAVLTISGVALTSDWAYRLWEPISRRYMDCASLIVRSNTTVLCALPYFTKPSDAYDSIAQGVPYSIVAQHRTLGGTIYCSSQSGSTSSSSTQSDASASSTSGGSGCSVTFTVEPLPVLLSVTPSVGQAPITLTVFGSLFTGNATWVLPNASNLKLFVGASPCVIKLPVYFDRVICDMQLPCSSSSNSSEHTQVHGLVAPYGSTSSAFSAPIQFTCTMSVTSIAPTSGSTMGGQQVTIRGAGFPESSPNVTVGGISCTIRTYNGTVIVCVTSTVGAIVDLTGSVKVTSSKDPTVSATCCTYLYSALLTPRVDSVAPTTGSEGVRATVVGSRFTTGVQVEMSGILITDAVVLSPTSINLLIPRLPPATTPLRLSISGVGYAFHSSTLENFTYSLSISRVTPAKGSYQSGLTMTIVGTGLGINASTITSGTEVIQLPVTTVLICGRICSLLSLDFNTLTCSIPEYLDTFMVQQYPSSVLIRNLTSRNFTVYQKYRSATDGGGVGAVGWADVTASFSGDEELSNASPGIVAANHTEEFLMAANKHARVSLTKIWMLFDNVRNSSQNVSCTLRKVIATSTAAASFTTLQGSPDRDWGFDGTMWSSITSWSAMALDNGWASGDVGPLFDTARFFLLRCERLIPGETKIRGGRVSGTVLGLNANGGVCPINIVVTSKQQVFESCSDVTGASCTTFTYDSTSTPIVLSYSVPYSSNTAATRVTIAGSGFGLVADSVSNVAIGGLSCLTQLAQESTLVCVTQGRLRSPMTGNQGISIVGKGLGRMVAAVPFQGTEPWSSPSSWYQSDIPTPLSIVYIPKGTSIVLDHNPTTLTAIIIAGTLLIQDVAMDVRTCLIVVLEGGVLQGGNPAAPLASTVNFTFVSSEYLADTSDDTDVTNLLPSHLAGRSLHKALLVLGGTLRLYGATDTAVSSFLQQPAYAGNRTVVIQDRVAWAVGAQILIATVTPDITENEERTIIGKTLVGSTSILELDQPLTYNHARSTDSYLGNTFELTARVMTLTRNVAIRGDETSETTKEGVAILVTQNSQIALSAVRINRCGKGARRSGRREGSAPALELHSVKFAEAVTVLTQCVIRRSYDRGLVLRNTRLVTVASSLVYRTNGHGIAALDGNNVNITLTANLICRSGATKDESSADTYAANVYITHPWASLVNNYAFGASGDNIWLQWRDDRLSAPNPTCPSQRSLNLFSGNTLCGAARHGVYVSEAWLARASPCVSRQLGIASSNPFVTSVFIQTLVFGCRGSGFSVAAVGGLTISACYVIDTLQAGISVGSSGGTVTVGDTMISGLLATGQTLFRNENISLRDGLWVRGGALSFTISSLYIRNATGVSLRICPAVATEAPPSDMPVFMSSSKLTIAGKNLTTQAAFCGTVVFQDNDGSLTQVQREVYLISNDRGALNSKVFTMCRTFQDAAGDLPSTVAASIVDGATGRNRTLLMCDTYSTYLFFAVTLTLRGPTSMVLPDALFVRVFQDGVLLSSVNMTFVVSPSDVTRFEDARRQHAYPMVETQATFLVVDGRPSTVTAQSVIFSSRLQFLLTPLCANGTNGLVRCAPIDPEELYLSRVGASIPNFPSQFLIDHRSPTLYSMNMSSLAPQFALCASTAWVYTKWTTTVAPVVTLRNTLVSDTVQGVLARRRDTAAANISGTSTSLISLWFSTVPTSEAIGVFPSYCASSSWCIPSASYPTNASSGVAVVNTSWGVDASWRALAVPTSNTTVAVIPQGVSMTLNTSIGFPLQALVVMGTLIIDGSTNDVLLRVTQLIVMGTLRIMATRTSSVVVELLTGAEDDAAVRHMKCGETPLMDGLTILPGLVIPCGCVYVAGSLSATGAARPTWWNIQSDVLAGSRTLGIPTSAVTSQLSAGWRVGLTSSDPQHPQGEQNIVTDSVNGLVRRPWAFRHASTYFSGGTYRFPEAVNFAKTVIFQCGNAPAQGNTWDRTTGGASGGCRFVVHRHADLTSIATLMSSRNELFLSHSMVEGFGYTLIAPKAEGETPAPSVVNVSASSTAGAADLNNNTNWLGLAAPGNPALRISGTATNVTISNSLIVNSSHMALVVAQSSVPNGTTLSIDNMVVWNCNGTGIALAGSGGVMSNVLVAGASYARYADNTIATNPSTPLCAIMDVSGTNRLATVVAAGSEAEGICIPWSACSLSQHTSITAHACSIGIFLFDPCDLPSGIGANCTTTTPASTQPSRSTACSADQLLTGTPTVYRNSFIGLQSTQHAQLSLQNIISSHNPVGVYATTRIGAAGPTRITSSVFTGVAPTGEGCEEVTCSSSFAFQSPVDCTTTLFTSVFYFVGVLMAPSSMGGVAITYDRSAFPVLGVVQPQWAQVSMSLNASAFSTITLSGNTFSSFLTCGYGLAFNPLALATDAPYIVASNIKYDATTPSTIYVPTSTAPLAGQQNGVGCTSETRLCSPYQSLMIVDSDGSIRSANATSLLVMSQQGTSLMSCSSTVNGLDVCPTTIAFGRLIVQSPMDSMRLSLECVGVRANYGTVVPAFVSCNAHTRSVVLPPDPILTLLTLTGVTVTLSSLVIPRRLMFTLAQCTSDSSIVLTVMMLEYSTIRTSVWVDGSLREMGTASPTVASRNGEWYRNPLIIGDDTDGDAADWVALTIACGSTVDVHQVVHGTLKLIMNTSAALITFGYRQQISQMLAVMANRSTATVFVASAVPADPPTQSVVTVLFEAEDSVDYNATEQALVVNAALGVIAALGPEALSANLDLLVFSLSTTPVALVLTSPVAAPPYFTLYNVIVFCGAAGALVAIAMIFYWYLLALRVSVARAAKRTYEGITFGREVELLPSTDDVDDDFGIEETVPETSLEARLIAYLDDWKIPLSKPIFADVAMMASSARSTPNSTPGDRPMAPPPGAGMESFRTREGSGGASVINAFLQMNDNDGRLRSPRPVVVVPPTSHGPASSQRRGSLHSFQLDPEPAGPATQHEFDDNSDVDQPSVTPVDDERAARCVSAATVASGSRSGSHDDDDRHVIVTPILMSPPSVRPQELLLGTPKPPQLGAHLSVSVSSAVETPIVPEMLNSARRRVSFTFGAPTPPSSTAQEHHKPAMGRSQSGLKPPTTPRGAVVPREGDPSTPYGQQTPVEPHTAVRVSPEEAPPTLFSVPAESLQPSTSLFDFPPHNAEAPQVSQPPPPPSAPTPNTASVTTPSAHTI